MFPKTCSVRFLPLPFAFSVFFSLPQVLQCHCCEIPSVIIPDIILSVLSSWLPVTGNSHMKEDLWRDRLLCVLPLTCSFFSVPATAPCCSISVVCWIWSASSPCSLTEGTLKAVAQHIARETAPSYYPILKATALCIMFSSLLNHSFSCNLRWALHFSAQLWTLGLRENWHCCHLSFSHQSHLCLDLENLCSLSWSNPVNVFSLTITACPFLVR